jgi:hypothetical protein
MLAGYRKIRLLKAWDAGFAVKKVRTPRSIAILATGMAARRAAGVKHGHRPTSPPESAA